MALGTYTDLKDSVASWLNRRNLTAQIPDFIVLAEADIASRLRDRRMVKAVEASTDCGVMALPGDWLEALDVRIVGAETPLRFLPLWEMNSARADCDGAPGFYSIRGTDLLLLPEPSADEEGVFPSLQMTYYARPHALTDDFPTNWLLTAEPEVYLYGSLVKAAPYMIDDDRLPTWGTLYGDVVQRLNNASKIAVVSGGPLVRGRRGFG